MNEQSHGASSEVLRHQRIQLKLCRDRRMNALPINDAAGFVINDLYGSVCSDGSLVRSATKPQCRRVPKTFHAERDGCAMCRKRRSFGLPLFPLPPMLIREICGPDSQSCFGVEPLSSSERVGNGRQTSSRRVAAQTLLVFSGRVSKKTGKAWCVSFGTSCDELCANVVQNAPDEHFDTFWQRSETMRPHGQRTCFELFPLRRCERLRYLDLDYRCGQLVHGGQMFSDSAWHGFVRGRAPAVAKD